MQKSSITLTFEDEKLEALEFSLRKEKTSVQKKMEEALRTLYEQSVPEAVREYLESKSAVVKPKRPAKSPSPKPENREIVRGEDA